MVADPDFDPRYTDSARPCTTSTATCSRPSAGRSLRRRAAPARGGGRARRGGADRAPRSPRLLADGTDPDEIASPSASPIARGPLLARVLSGLGDPGRPRGRMPLAGTAIGRGADAALRAAGAPGSERPRRRAPRPPALDPAVPAASVDWLERSMRRGEGDDEHRELIGGWEQPPRHLGSRPGARDGPRRRLRALARCARGAGAGARTAERPPCAGPCSPPAGRRPDRAARRAEVAAEPSSELAAPGALPGCRGPSSPSVEAIHARRCPPGGARRRGASASSARTGCARQRAVPLRRRAQDGSFPARGGSDPLLAEDRRAARQSPPAAPPTRRGALPLPLLRLAAESRLYLLPTRRATSRRRCRAAPSSTRCSTCSAPAAEQAERRGRGRDATGLDRVVPDAPRRRAPRASWPAPWPPAAPAPPARAALELPAGVGDLALDAIDAAATALVPARGSPGRSTHPDVLAELGAERPC